jgi:hypothetical protein
MIAPKPAPHGVLGRAEFGGHLGERLCPLSDAGIRSAMTRVVEEADGIRPCRPHPASVGVYGLMQAAQTHIPHCNDLEGE